MTLLLALLFGVIAGLRTMTALAAASAGAWLGLLPVDGTLLSALAHPWTLVVFALLAAAELLFDKLPSVPPRTRPTAFIARLLSGAVSGAAVGMVAALPLAGLAAGTVGAVCGTLGGLRLRQSLSRRLGNLPAALAEDAVALTLAVLVLVTLPS